MFTKEFIKISQILDHHGMHRQADDLLKIAQAKPPVSKNPLPKVPVRNVNFITPDEQNLRLKKYTERVNQIKPTDKKETIVNLKNTIDLQYKNNYLDYDTYKRIISLLQNKSASIKDFDTNSIAPINPVNPTAFPVNVNETLIRGRGLVDSKGKPIIEDGNPVTNAISLADPVEGVTAAGEKAFQNREDRNLPKLQKEWNEYLQTDSFKTSIQSRIDWLKKNEPGTDTTQLQQLLDKANNKDTGLKVGDFGNIKDNMTESSQIYGVEAKPATSITGTPTTPAPGTATTPTPPTQPTVQAPSR